MHLCVEVSTEMSFCSAGEVGFNVASCKDGNTHGHRSPLRRHCAVLLLVSFLGSGASLYLRSSRRHHFWSPYSAPDSSFHYVGDQRLLCVATVMVFPKSEMHCCSGDARHWCLGRCDLGAAVWGFSLRCGHGEVRVARSTVE
jgi:hypothetical protein